MNFLLKMMTFALKMMNFVFFRELWNVYEVRNATIDWLEMPSLTDLKCYY